MATINFLKRKDSKNSGTLGSVIAYCTQRYKTEIEDTNVRLISGVNCIAERAFKDFMDTKKQFNKTVRQEDAERFVRLADSKGIAALAAYDFLTFKIISC